MFELAIILAPAAAVFGWVAWDLHRSAPQRDTPRDESVTEPTLVIVEGAEIGDARPLAA